VRREHRAQRRQIARSRLGGGGQHAGLQSPGQRQRAAVRLRRSWGLIGHELCDGAGITDGEWVPGRGEQQRNQVGLAVGGDRRPDLAGVRTTLGYQGQQGGVADRCVVHFTTCQQPACPIDHRYGDPLSSRRKTAVHTHDRYTSEGVEMKSTMEITRRHSMVP
jgi:hypothetical protein